MSQLQKEYGDLSTAISKHGEDWHREIDKLVKKLKAEVDEMKITQLQTLQKHQDEINKKMSDIKDEINSVDAALNSNNISKLFSVTSEIDIFRNLPEKIVPSIPKFTPGKIQVELSKVFGTLISSSLASDKHGYSMKTQQKSPEVGSSPPVKQLLDEPETVITINTEYSQIYNVACLKDEEIWTSGDDSTMELYSINQGSLLKSIATRSGYRPWDIAVTKSGDLVYTDINDRTVNIMKNEKIEMIRLQNWRPHGVCSTSSGDLLVIMDSDTKPTKVVRYSGYIEKQTIQFENKSKTLYSNGYYNIYRYITENRNLDICVSDSGANAVVVVNQTGKLRLRYTGHTPALNNKTFNPRGITTDSQSHILTVDLNNYCVRIIDLDGKFLRYIVNGPSRRFGLCTDTNDNLFVAKHGNRQVMKIKYLQ